MSDLFEIRETTSADLDVREPEGCEICGHCRLLRTMLCGSLREPRPQEPPVTEASSSAAGAQERRLDL